MATPLGAPVRNYKRERQKRERAAFAREAHLNECLLPPKDPCIAPFLDNRALLPKRPPTKTGRP